MNSITAVDCLAALAHEGRLNVFKLLVQAAPEGRPVGTLAEMTDSNFTTVSAQLAVLSNTGLITAKRSGRSISYSVDFAAMGSLMNFMFQDCCGGDTTILATCCANVEAED